MKVLRTTNYEVRKSIKKKEMLKNVKYYMIIFFKILYVSVKLTGPGKVNIGK